MPSTAICQRIVVRAGGWIRVESGPGCRGSRFYFTVLSEKTRGIGSVRKTISVLLAEDNPADAGLVQEALEEQGIKGDLTVIADGETAIMSIDYVMRSQSTFPISL
jgi:hypothetical protein